MPQRVSLPRIAQRVAKAYDPEEIARVGSHTVIMVRYQGSYPAHQHDEDEFLLCLEGEIQVKLPDGEVTLKPLDGLRIPAGTLHEPSAEDAVGLLFEARDLVTKIPAKADRDHP